jgi:hypothetical protein
LAPILQQHPDLIPVIEAWPTLPKLIKTSVMAIIENYAMEGKDDGESETNNPNQMDQGRMRQL